MSQDIQLELVDNDGTPEQPSAANQAIATLPPVERAALVLKSSETEKQLLELVQKSVDIKEVKNADGREQAHRMAMDLRKARTTITNNGKAARDDANAFCSAVLAEEKRLIALTKAEEERVFKLRDEWDAKVKAEKEERERKEAERKAAIQAKIDAIVALPLQSVNDSAADLAATLDDLRAFDPSEAEFQEFRQVAVQAATNAINQLTPMHLGAVAREQAAAELAAQKAELERQQAEIQRQQDELDRKRREQEEAEAQRMAAEDARVAAPAEQAWSQVDIDRADNRQAQPFASFVEDSAHKPLMSAEEANAYVQIANTLTPEQTTKMAERAQALLSGADPALWGATEDAINTGIGAVRVEHVPSADIRKEPGIITLRFEGYSNDTFGEVEHFGDDFDNAASGKPIRYLVTHPDVPGGLVVVGQYGREDVPGDWFIGVAGYDPDYADVPMPDWPMRIVRSERPYSPSLIIEAPAGAVVRCLERQEG